MSEYELPVTGSPPNQTTTREAHEQQINEAISAALVNAAAQAGLLSLANATGVNTIEAELPSALSAVTITTGTAALLNPTGSNTGNVTLDVGDGAKPVLDGNLEQLPAGTLRQNRPALLRYSTSGGGRWVLASSGLTRAELLDALNGIEDLQSATEDLQSALEAKLDADAATPSEHRPGEAPGAWGGSLLGKDISPLPGTVIEDDSVLVKCIEITDQQTVIAPRRPKHIEPGRIYAVRGVIRRTVAPSDPAGDVVRIGVRWLDANGGSVGNSVVEEINPVAATGVFRTAVKTLSMNLTPRDIVIPSAARQARVYAQTFGSYSTTRVGTLQLVDVTDLEPFATMATQAALDAQEAADEAEAASGAAGASAAASADANAQTQSARDQVEILALAAGSPVFATYALALAGIEDIPADAVVFVMQDETRQGRVSLYQRSGAALVFLRHWSVDGFWNGSVEFSVGTGGDFSTVTDALGAIDARRRAFGRGAAYTIRLLSSFVMAEQVIVDGPNLLDIRIISDDAVVAVDPDGITETIADIDDARPIFGAVGKGSALPVIAALFAYADNTTAWDGVAVYGGASAQIAPECGVRRCRRGIMAYNGSSVVCNIDGLRSVEGNATAERGVDFRECLGRALDVQQGSTVSLPRSNFDDCEASLAVYLIWGCWGNLYQSSARRAAGTAFHARDGSFLNARECDADAAGNRAFHALHGAIINARGKIGGTSNGFGVHAAKNCTGSIAVLASHASIIDAQGLDASGAGSRCFNASDGSTINARGALALSSGSVGFNAQRAATINAHASDASGSGTGYEASEGSTVNAESSEASNCSFGYLARRGSTIAAAGSTADSCVRAYEARNGSTIDARSTTATNSASRAYSVIDGARMNVQGGNSSGNSSFALTVRGGGRVEARGYEGSVDLRDGGGEVHLSDRVIRGSDLHVFQGQVSTPNLGTAVEEFGVVVSAHGASEPSIEDAVANATALQQAIDTCAAQGRALILPDGVIWVANYHIRKTNSVALGVDREGGSVIKMHGAVHRSMPLSVSSRRDDPQGNIHWTNITFDANRARWSRASVGDPNENRPTDNTDQVDTYGEENIITFTTEEREAAFGDDTGALTQSAFIASDVNDWQSGEKSVYTNIRGIDGYKHCIDVTAPSYGRGRGSIDGPRYYDPQPACGIELIRPYAVGAGDDGITTHQCLWVNIYDPFGDVTSGVRTGNTNCIEIDDGSRLVNIYGRAVAVGGTTGMEIKGHSDSPAPWGIYVEDFTAVNCNIGIEPRHLGHHRSASATFDVFSVDQGADTFVFSGDLSEELDDGDTFTISGSTGNDGTYGISEILYDEDNDRTAVIIITDPDDENLPSGALTEIPDDTADGGITFTSPRFSQTAKNVRFGTVRVIAPRRMSSADDPRVVYRRNDGRRVAKLKGYDGIYIDRLECYEGTEIDTTEIENLALSWLPTDIGDGHSQLIRGYLNARNLHIGTLRIRGFRGAVLGAYFTSSFGRGQPWRGLHVGFIDSRNGPRTVFRATTPVTGVVVGGYDIVGDHIGESYTSYGVRLSGSNAGKSLGPGNVQGYSDGNVWDGVSWQEPTVGFHQPVMAPLIKGRSSLQGSDQTESGTYYAGEYHGAPEIEENDILLLCKAETPGTAFRGEIVSNRALSLNSANTSSYRARIDYVVSSNGSNRCNYELLRLHDTMRMQLVEFQMGGVRYIGLQNTSGVTGSPLRFGHIRFTGTRTDEPLAFTRVQLSDLDEWDDGTDTPDGEIFDALTNGDPIVDLYNKSDTFGRAYSLFQEAEVLTRRNAVGTVSDGPSASGNWLGAIQEAGENANGEYMRLANGWQICTNANAAITTNPAAFVGTVTSLDGDKMRIGRWF